MTPTRDTEQQYSLWPTSPKEMAPDYALRPYQREAVEHVQEELRQRKSTILVLATGTGKTQIAVDVCRQWRGRCLFLVHTDELAEQAQTRLREMTGEHVELEKGPSHARRDSRLVVASVQTLSRAARLESWRKEHFGLLVVDECHHAVARTWRKVLAHFAEARILGLTATPERGDNRALGAIFESVAYTYSIHKGISDGYLVPITMGQVVVESINLSHVRTKMGDLDQKQLDEVMAQEENLHGVVWPTIERAGDRSTLIYTTSVANAERIAEIFNERYRQGCACAVSGDTNLDHRRSIVRRYEQGEFQFLVNVNVFTEGYDSPRTSCIACARPTKSRALYTQIVGRGLRPFSGKSDALILDFAGNSGRHDLVTIVDLLGGDFSEPVRARAKKLAQKYNVSVDEALAQAKREEMEAKIRQIRNNRASVTANVKYSFNHVDPFAVLGLTQSNPRNDKWGKGPADDRDLIKLARFRVDIPPHCTRRQAKDLLTECYRRVHKNLCTFRQMKALERQGHDCREMSFDTASKLMSRYKELDWKPIPQEELKGILYGQR